MLEWSTSVNRLSRAASDCQVFDEDNKPTDSGTTTKAPALISVGTVQFGPVLQKHLLPLQQDRNNHYNLFVEPQVPANAYQVIADGETGASPFGGVLSMPEAFKFVQVEGKDFGDPSLSMSLSKSNLISWQAPNVPNDLNLVFLEVSLTKGTRITGVSCGWVEDRIPELKGYKQWNLDNSYLSGIPASEDVAFTMIRAHLRREVTEATDLRFQGLRTYFTRVNLTK
jgi:hypothetical protein